MQVSNHGVSVQQHSSSSVRLGDTKPTASKSEQNVPEGSKPQTPKPSVYVNTQGHSTGRLLNAQA